MLISIGCSGTFSDMNFMLHGRCKESVTCGSQKREFTWQVQGIGHVVKIRGRCQNVGTRASFEGLRFMWQARAGNPHQGPYVLRSKGSIPEKGCIFGT